MPVAKLQPADHLPPATASSVALVEPAPRPSETIQAEASISVDSVTNDASNVIDQAATTAEISDVPLPQTKATIAVTEAAPPAQSVHETIEIPSIPAPTRTDPSQSSEPQAPPQHAADIKPVARNTVIYSLDEPVVGNVLASEGESGGRVPR